jgi:cytochrome c biogenesis protein CcmG/thiol:disulfide interchange protein DsbE
VIPLIAVGVVVAFAALLGWSLFAPESARQNTSTLIGNAIVYDNPNPASEFSMQTLDGTEMIALSDLKGKTVIVNFWAAWCAPCRNEMPLLNQASAEFDDSIVLVGVNTQDDPDDARVFVAELGVPYPVLDETTSEFGPVGVEYGVHGIPETFLISKDGDLIALFRGEFKSVSDIHEFVALAP